VFSFLFLFFLFIYLGFRDCTEDFLLACFGKVQDSLKATFVALRRNRTIIAVRPKYVLSTPPSLSLYICAPFSCAEPRSSGDSRTPRGLGCLFRCGEFPLPQALSSIPLFPWYRFSLHLHQTFPERVKDRLALTKCLCCAARRKTRSRMKTSYGVRHALPLCFVVTATVSADHHATGVAFTIDTAHATEVRAYLGM